MVGRFEEISRESKKAKPRLTKRAQMKWEVKGEEEIANKKTNQTENSSARLSWG